MSFNFSSALGNATEIDSFEPTFRDRLILWMTAIFSLLIMSWLSGTFSIPAEPGFSASLFQQGGWIAALLVVISGIFIVMFASAAIGSALRSDAAVFCTSLSCAAISWRGGTMQATLFASGGASVFIVLAIEVTILFAALVAAWLVLQKARGGAKIAPQLDENDQPPTLDENLLALFTQAVAMMAMMILLCRSDVKSQVLGSVFISSAAGAAVAGQFVKLRSSFWLWIGPLAVALLGYSFQSFHCADWQIGLLHGPLAGLARPLPLDYVSMGPAGAIFGYWFTSGSPTEEEGEIPLDATPSQP